MNLGWTQESALYTTSKVKFRNLDPGKGDEMEKRGRFKRGKKRDDNGRGRGWGHWEVRCLIPLMCTARRGGLPKLGSPRNIPRCQHGRSWVWGLGSKTKIEQ